MMLKIFTQQSVNIGFRYMEAGFISSNKNTKYGAAIFENMVNYNLTMENAFKIKTVAKF